MSLGIQCLHLPSSGMTSARYNTQFLKLDFGCPQLRSSCVQIKHFTDQAVSEALGIILLCRRNYGQLWSSPSHEFQVEFHFQMHFFIPNQPVGSSHGSHTSPTRCLTNYSLRTAKSLQFIKHALRTQRGERKSVFRGPVFAAGTEKGCEDMIARDSGQRLNCRQRMKQEEASECMTGNSWPKSTSNLGDPSGRTDFTSCGFLGNTNLMCLQKPQL